MAKDTTTPDNEATRLIYHQIKRVLPGPLRVCKMRREDYDDLLGACRWAYAEWLAWGEPVEDLSEKQKRQVSNLAQRLLYRTLQGMGWRKQRVPGTKRTAWVYCP